MTRFQLRLYQARVARGHTQWQAGVAIHVRPETWSRWERGEMKPTGNHLVKVARYVGCTVATLREAMTEEQPPERKKQTETQRLRQEIRDAEEALEVYGITGPAPLWERIRILGERWRSEERRGSANSNYGTGSIDWQAMRSSFAAIPKPESIPKPDGSTTPQMAPPTSADGQKE